MCIYACETWCFQKPTFKMISPTAVWKRSLGMHRAPRNTVNSAHLLVRTISTSKMSIIYQSDILYPSFHYEASCVGLSGTTVWTGNEPTDTLITCLGPRSGKGTPGLVLPIDSWQLNKSGIASPVENWTDGQFIPFHGVIPFLGIHPKERFRNVVNSSYT